MSPESIVKLMMKNDLFSQWMDIQVVEIKLGKCVLEASVKEEMLNEPPSEIPPAAFS